MIAFPQGKRFQGERLIFTGAPGSGKTSVIIELEKLGYIVVHEAATDVISQERVKGVEKPWEEPDFLEQITYVQKERQMNAAKKLPRELPGDLAFYDRSPFWTYALGQYLSHHKNVEFTPSAVLRDEMDRCLKDRIYQNKVFFFENLGFIEHTDARKISYEDALMFEQIHLDVYKAFGFDIIIVPKALTVTQRCAFILEKALC